MLNVVGNAALEEAVVARGLLSLLQATVRLDSNQGTATILPETLAFDAERYFLRCYTVAFFPTLYTYTLHYPFSILFHLHSSCISLTRLSKIRDIVDKIGVECSIVITSRQILG